MGVADQVFGVWQTIVTLVLIVILVNIHSLGTDWETKVSDVDVYTIQDPKFWGAMTMLVPNNCTFLLSKFGTNGTNASHTSARMMELSAALDAKPPLQTSLLGHPVLPAQDAVNSVSMYLAVHKCGHTVEALNVSTLQYYFDSMRTATEDFDIGYEQTTRMRLFFFFAFTVFGMHLAISFITKQMMQSLDDPLQRQMMKSQNSFLACGLFTMKIYSFLQLINIVLLFVYFWVEDHYLMNYYPGRAYVYLMVSGPILSALQMCMIAAQNQAVMACGGFFGFCINCYISVFVAIPIGTGYALYSLQFLFVFFAGTYTDQMDPGARQDIDHVFSLILGINVVDFFVTMALLFCKEANGREPQEIGADYFNLEADSETADRLYDQ